MMSRISSETSFPLGCQMTIRFQPLSATTVITMLTACNLWCLFAYSLEQPLSTLSRQLELLSTQVKHISPPSTPTKPSTFARDDRSEAAQIAWLKKRMQEIEGYGIEDEGQVSHDVPEWIGKPVEYGLGIASNVIPTYHTFSAAVDTKKHKFRNIKAVAALSTATARIRGLSVTPEDVIDQLKQSLNWEDLADAKPVDKEKLPNDKNVRGAYTQLLEVIDEKLEVKRIVDLDKTIINIELTTATANHPISDITKKIKTVLQDLKRNLFPQLNISDLAKGEGSISAYPKLATKLADLTRAIKEVRAKHLVSMLHYMTQQISEDKKLKGINSFRELRNELGKLTANIPKKFQSTGTNLINNKFQPLTTEYPLVQDAFAGLATAINKYYRDLEARAIKLITEVTQSVKDLNLNNTKSGQKKTKLLDTIKPIQQFFNQNQFENSDVLDTWLKDHLTDLDQFPDNVKQSLTKLKEAIEAHLKS
jgi:hypothetical protein